MITNRYLQFTDLGKLTILMLPAVVLLVSFGLCALSVSTYGPSPIQMIPSEILQKAVAPLLCPSSIMVLSSVSENFMATFRAAFFQIYSKSSVVNVELLYDIYNKAGPIEPYNLSCLQGLTMKFLPLPRDVKHQRVYLIYKDALFDDKAIDCQPRMTRRFPELCRMILKYKRFTESSFAPPNYRILSRLLKPYSIDVGLLFLERAKYRPIPNTLDENNLEPDAAISYHDFLIENQLVNPRRQVSFIQYIRCLRLSADGDIDDIRKQMSDEVGPYFHYHFFNIIKYADPRIVLIAWNSIAEQLNVEEKYIRPVILHMAIHNSPILLYESIRGEVLLRMTRSIIHEMVVIRMTRCNLFQSQYAIELHLEAGLMLGAPEESLLKILDFCSFDLHPYLAILACIKKVPCRVFYTILEKLNTMESGISRGVEYIKGKPSGFDLSPFMFTHILCSGKNVDFWFQYLWGMASKETRSVGLLCNLPQTIQKRIARKFGEQEDFSVGLAKTHSPLESLAQGMFWLSEFGCHLDLPPTGYELNHILNYIEKTLSPSEILLKIPMRIKLSLSSLCAADSSGSWFITILSKIDDTPAIIKKHFLEDVQSYYMTMFALQSPELKILEMVELMPYFADLKTFFVGIKEFFAPKLNKYRAQIDELISEIGNRMSDERYLRIVGLIYSEYIFQNCFLPGIPLFEYVQGDQLKQLLELGFFNCCYVVESKTWTDYFHRHGLLQQVFDTVIRENRYNFTNLMRMAEHTLSLLGLTKMDVHARMLELIPPDHASGSSSDTSSYS